MEQTLIFHSDLFHEVSLDYHTQASFLNREWNYLSRKWRRIKKALRLNDVTKYIYLTKIQFFFICSGVNMPINLMNFLTPVVRGKNLVSRQSCKSRAKHNWQHYKRKRKKIQQNVDNGKTIFQNLKKLRAFWV